MLMLKERELGDAACGHHGEKQLLPVLCAQPWPQEAPMLRRNPSCPPTPGSP